MSDYDRILGICDGGETLLWFAPTSETDEGVYYLALRCWPHPERPDEWTTLSLRYAYLTKGGGSDGWVDGDAAGINIRIEGDPAEFVAEMARGVAASKPRLDGSGQPSRSDLRSDALESEE